MSQPTFTQEQSDYLNSLGSTLETLVTRLDAIDQRLNTFQVPTPVKEEIRSVCLADGRALFESRIDALESRGPNRILQDRIAALEQRIAGTPIQQPASTIVTKSSVKLKEPPKFGGKRDECRSFFAHLALHFARYPDEFKEEHAKVIFAISYLEGQPFKHMEPYLAKLNIAGEPSPAILSDFALFEKTMTNSYGIVNAPVAAAAKIKVLKQTTTVAAYATEFRRLAMDLSWNDEALASQFEDGLKDSILDALANEPIITNLDKLINRATELDDRHFARTFAKKMSSSSSAVRRPHVPVSVPANVPRTANTVGPSTPAPARSAPEPMDLSQARKLSAAERQRRIDNKLCLYCGSDNHLRANCPLKPSDPLHSLDDSEVVFDLGNE